MLSYRHAYHAGNPADVLKHLVLANTLDYMTRKPAPLLYIDTHAGAGRYPLTALMARKNAEHRDGILAVDFSALPACVEPYHRAMTPWLEKNCYPGSPLIAAGLLREQDKLRLFELHPQDGQWLTEQFKSDRRVKVELSDGFQSLKALLPAAQKRALVMIDPSYEIKTDYEKVVSELSQAWKRMPGAQYLLWYPVVERARIDRLLKRLVRAGLRDVWQVELGMKADSPDYGMTASGMVLVNPPWQLAGQLQDILPVLQNQLSAQEGYYKIEQLVSE